MVVSWAVATAAEYCGSSVGSVVGFAVDSAVGSSVTTNVSPECVVASLLLHCWGWLAGWLVAAVCARYFVVVCCYVVVCVSLLFCCVGYFGLVPSVLVAVESA